MATSGGDRERQQRRVEAQAERERRSAERTAAAEDKQREQARIAGRKEAARRRTVELEHRVAELRSVLQSGLTVPAGTRADDLEETVHVAPLNLGELVDPIAPTAWDLVEPARPGGVSRMLGGGRRYQEQWNAARQRYDAYVAEVEQSERARRLRVAQLEREHADELSRRTAAAVRHNEAIQRLRRGVPDRVKECVEDFLGHVLDRLPLPESFPSEYAVTYSPSAEQALVQMSLPPREVVPDEKAHRYVERGDEDKVTVRPAREAADLYRDVVAQVVVLALRNLLASDFALQRIGVNGHVRAIDPATGEWDYPCLISVDVAREDFPREEALRNVDAPTCLRRLKAIVSQHPYALDAIEPVLDFDLTKFAFVQGLDAAATLDYRPNLLHMSATNFEHLVRQLFEAQGAEGWTTTQSHDDGVDAVILNRSNLIGGLAVVQAKRYKPSNVLGPSHYRELAGTMEEKKAGWGVLVTTSRFTAGCEQKARDHGRMQLIDGPRLVWMVREYLGRDVLIG